MINIKKPTLIINETVVKANIQRMAEKARKNDLALRPHFKTHHSADVGNWFLDFGIDKITVSSVSMANYFAEHGWKDITVAFPYNPLEIEDINSLAGKIKLQVLIESEESLAHLSQHSSNFIEYFIKIDVGSHRTGLEPHQIELAKKLAEGKESAKCIGLLAHAGHTYSCRNHEEIQKTSQKSMSIIREMKDSIGNDDLMISYGDTPGCSVLDNFDGIDEIRPGNFVYYDLMQSQISACRKEDIGVSLACPVVAEHESRHEVVVYGGAVHLSKDRIQMEGQTTFGQPVRYEEDGWKIIPNCRIDRLSQEHGIIKCDRESFDSFKIGDIIGILPVHSCLVADMMSAQQTISGKKIEKMPKI